MPIPPPGHLHHTMKTNVCQTCSRDFACIEYVNGYKIKLHKRRNCLKCVPIGTRPDFYTRGNLKYIEQEFRNAVAKSKSVRETLLMLGVNSEGSAYKTFARACLKWTVSTDHFTGMRWAKGQVRSKRSIEEYLTVESHSIGSHYLKVRLLAEGYFEHKCYQCNRRRWNGKPIPIELEHINGIHHDNRLENLTILCPNCHAQTATHAGRNRLK